MNRRINRKIIMVTIILAMVSITWLFGKNRALTQLLGECQIQDTNHVDLILDLEHENADLMDYIMTLEMDNAGMKDSLNKLTSKPNL